MESRQSLEISTSNGYVAELDEEERHPLIEASRNGDIDALTTLLSGYEGRGQIVRTYDHQGWQAIHYASKLYDTSCLCALLAYDGELAHCVTENLMTPLIVASMNSNTAGVKALLEYLADTDLAKRDSNGDNALYYAAMQSRNTEQATEIALLLLDRKHTIEDYESSKGDVPFNAMCYKNEQILQRLLDAHLDIEYHCRPIYYHTTHLVHPDTLMAHCVFFDWTRGFELLIKTVKRKLANTSKEMIKSRLHHLFIQRRYAYPYMFNGSAWELVFLMGNIECLNLMLSEGMTLKTSTRPFHYSENIPYFPMSQVLGVNLWEKQDFIKHFLSMQSCADFDSHFKETVERLRYERDSHQPDSPTTIDHPVLCAAESILVESKKGHHTIEESVRMLIKCGFSFDFRYVTTNITRRRCKLWYNSLEILVDSFCYPDYVALTSVILKYTNKLPITACAIVCGFIDYPLRRIQRILQSSSESWELYILEKLSQLPENEINTVYEQLSVVEATLMYSGQKEGTHGRQFNWVDIAHCILKGFKVASDDDLHYDLEDSVIPFSVLMLSDWNRKYYLHDNLQLTDDPYKQTLIDQPVSSLKALCRVVIRGQIKPADMLKEPVPKQNHFYERNITGASWEVSTIDRLPISNMMKDFLRYGPEFREYAVYRERMDRYIIIEIPMNHFIAQTFIVTSEQNALE